MDAETAAVCIRNKAEREMEVETHHVQYCTETNLKEKRENKKVGNFFC